MIFCFYIYVKQLIIHFHDRIYLYMFRLWLIYPFDVKVVCNFDTD
jgi:hypothetical protein